ncbi:helix-turn-helix domain-containing protein [Promicromonospora sp. NPDC060204]
MTRSLDDLDRARPVDPEKVAAAEERLLARQRAWQLRELRTQQALTQAELAERMHVGQNRVSQIESGGAESTRLDTLRRYAQALGGTLSVEVTIGDTRYIVA